MKTIKKLSKMFHECAYEMKYQEVGDSVNYAFKEEEDSLYIYFEGSNSTTDWKRNFLFKKRPYKGMEVPYRVHRGFLVAWKEVEDIIIKKITEITEKDFKWKRIFVIGYSHGGALAAFCHECVWFYRPDLREDGLYGFGFEAPRIYGCFTVKEELKERWKTFTVIRTNNDLVTYCPPAIFGYCHVGILLQINGNINLVQDNRVPQNIKPHYPQVVYDALLKMEEEK